MNTPSTKTAVTLSVALCVVSLIGAACASRYRLDLYVTAAEHRQRIEVESDQYVMDAVVGHPYADDKVAAGPGNVAVVTIGGRGTATESHRWHALGFDESFRCQVYVQVPPMPQRDTSVLVDRSLIHILGRYEQPIEERVFLPREGLYIVDSITEGDIFFTIDGVYANASGDRIQLDGRFKVSHNFYRANP